MTRYSEPAMYHGLLVAIYIKSANSYKLERGGHIPGGAEQSEREWQMSGLELPHTAQYIGDVVLAALGLRFQDHLCPECRIRVQEPVYRTLHAGFPELCNEAGALRCPGGLHHWVLHADCPEEGNKRDIDAGRW